MNKIYCMDALELLRQIPDNSINLMVTSPPYNASRPYDIYNDNINFSDYIGCLNKIWQECIRILAPDGKLVINIADQYSRTKEYGLRFCLANHYHILKFFENKLYHYDTIIWQKNRFSNITGGKPLFGSYPYPTNFLFLSNYEYILVFKKQGKRQINREIKEKSRVLKKEFFEYTKGVWIFNGESSSNHPAIFPEELPKRCIKLLSFYQDIVIDPFCGIGTTCLVAKQLGRKFIGCDISQEYVNIANKRLSQEVLNFNI